MSTHDITIDDGCPLITYTGTWNDSTNENILGQYWLNTYHSTSEVGASASFKFTGTAVYLYGSKRSSHGAYEVDVDGNSLGEFDGTSSTTQNLALLASAGGLTWGEHTVTITNSDSRGRFLDIDQIRWTTGKAGLTSITNTTQVDDADDSAVVSYSPTDSWSSVDPTGQTGGYHQNTVHTTSTLSSAVTVRFSGNAIYIFGATDSSSGTYSVQIDGGSAVSLEGATTTFRQPALLYYADGLDSGDHTFTLTNRQEGSVLRFDYAVGSTWTQGSSTGNPTASPGSAAASIQSKQGSNTTAIVGGIIGGIVGFVLLVLFALCFLRLRSAAKMDETQPDAKVVAEDENKTKPRPLSQFSWTPQRSWIGARPLSTVSGVSGISGVSGASGPGMAGVGAHSKNGWAFRRRSGQQFGAGEKAYRSSTLSVPPD